MAFPYRVGVTVFLVDRVSAGLMNIARNMSNATVAGQALRAQMYGIGSALKVGAGITMIGVGGLAVMGKMVEHAAAFQMNMVRISNLFKMTTEQARLFKNEVFDISHTTMFSADQISDVALGMKQVGLNMDNIVKLLPQFSAAGEILFRVGGIAPKETGRAMGEFAHTLGVYDPKGLARLGEVLVNASQLIPGGPQALITQLGYMKPAQIMGIPPGNLTDAQREEYTIQGGIKMVELAALAQQIVGSRGGTGARGPLSGPALLNFMLGAAGVGTTLTGFSFIQNQLGRAALGFLDPKTGQSAAMPGGVFDPMAEFKQAQASMKMASTLEGQRQMIHQMVGEMSHMRLSRRQVENIMANPLIAGPLAGRVDNPGALVDLFAKMMSGQTGMRAMSVLASPGTPTAMNQLISTLTGAPSISQQQLRFLQALQGAWSQLTTDFHNLSIDIGLTLIPRTTQFVNGLDSIVNRMRQMVELHPKVTQTFAGIAVALSALTAASGVVIFVAALGRALMFLASTTTLLVGGGLVLALGLGLYELYKHFDGFKRMLQKYPNLDALINHPMKTLAEIFKNLSAKAKEFGDWLKKMFPDLAFKMPSTERDPKHPWRTPLGETLKDLKDFFTIGGPVDTAILGWLNSFIGMLRGPSAAAGKPVGFWEPGGARPSSGTRAAAFWAPTRSEREGFTRGGTTVSPGAIVINVHGDITGDGTIEKLRRELHAALLTLGGGGGGIYESGLTHGAPTMGI